MGDGLVTDAILPEAHQVEASLLGGILVEPKGIQLAQTEGLQATDFYLDGHAIIYRAMLRLAAREITPDVVTVPEELRKTEELDKVGGHAYVVGVTNFVVSGSGIRDHARLVIEKANARAIWEAAQGAARQVTDQNSAPETIASELRAALDTITGREVREDNIQPAEKFISDAAQRAIEAFKRGESSAHQSGFMVLDRHIGGWQPGAFYIWAARPNEGKTRTVLWSLVKLAKEGVKVAFLNLDMSADRLAAYLSSTILAVEGVAFDSPQDILTPTADINGEPALLKGLMEIDLGQNFYVVNETRTRRLAAIEGIAMRLAEKGVRILVIDQVQNIAEFIPEERQKLNYTVKGLQQIARRYNLAVVALHQINREGAEMPQVKNLKETGAFEEFADYVLLLHDPQRAALSAWGGFYLSAKGKPTQPGKLQDDKDILTQPYNPRMLTIIIGKSRGCEVQVASLPFDFKRGVVVRKDEVDYLKERSYAR